MNCVMLLWAFIGRFLSAKAYYDPNPNQFVFFFSYLQFANQKILSGT